MSYTVAITIACDADGCNRSITQTRVNAGGLSKTWAGALAVHQGWWIPGRPGTHDPKAARCPQHNKRGGAE